jgi:hypothetical protein
MQLSKRGILEKRILKNGFLELEYLTGSLRISGLTPAGKTNLLADLGDLAPVPTPYGDFYFRGGHRLWHAPESMPRTYIPDPGELKITELTNGVFLEERIEPGTGIRKQIEILLDPGSPTVRLTHTMVNEGLWPVELAPWAITQLRLGGTAILPMPAGDADPAGLLPNRQFSLWPYTRIDDPRLRLDDRIILFIAHALLPPFKIGYFNPHGWLAYWLDGVLFRKTFEIRESVAHPDNNSNAELYCNDRFVELETLGLLTTLQPNESITHLETWEIFSGLDPLPMEVQEALAS